MMPHLGQYWHFFKKDNILSLISSAIGTPTEGNNQGTTLLWQRDCGNDVMHTEGAYPLSHGKEKQLQVHIV